MKIDVQNLIRKLIPSLFFKSSWCRSCLSTNTWLRSVPSASVSFDNCATSDVLSTRIRPLLSSTRSTLAGSSTRAVGGPTWACGGASWAPPARSWRRLMHRWPSLAVHQRLWSLWYTGAVQARLLLLPLTLHLWYSHIRVEKGQTPTN